MPRVGPAPIDDAAVKSQAEAVATVSLANRAIDKLGLATNPEFDSVEANSRAVDRFLSRLTVIARPGSRVVQIELVSRDPELAARAANAVAEIHLQSRMWRRRRRRPGPPARGWRRRSRCSGPKSRTRTRRLRRSRTSSGRAIVGFATAITMPPGIFFPEHAERLSALPLLSVNGHRQSVEALEVLDSPFGV